MAAASLRTTGGGAGTMSFIFYASNKSGKSLAGVREEGSPIVRFGSATEERRGCEEGGSFEAKSDIRRPKSERNPKAEKRMQRRFSEACGPTDKAICRFRFSALLRVPVFGLRISAIPHVSA